jgi:hypothetical protein
MNARSILTEFNRRGIELRAVGNKLIAKPLSAVTPELRESVRQHKAEILSALASKPADQAAAPSPVYSILETCHRYGVALRIDPENGDLLVGKAGARGDEPTQPWRELLAQIEAHLESVARLVESGWTLKADFPKTGAA